MLRLLRAAAVVCVFLALVGPLRAEDGDEHLVMGNPSGAEFADHGDRASEMPSIYAPTALNWKDGPPSLPRGAKIAVLEGDPGKPGPLVFRVKVPDGYRIPPHSHPKPERVTVLSGTFYLGMGEKFDKTKGKEMVAGTYGTWPPGMKHFVWVKGETVVQFHGDGPWMIKYVNPADDPRKKD